MIKMVSYPNILEEPRARDAMIERMESLDKMLSPSYFRSRNPDKQKTIDEIREDFDKLIKRFKRIPVGVS